jgi:flagellar motor switch protein FliN
MSQPEPQVLSSAPLEELAPDTTTSRAASLGALIEVPMPVAIEIGRTTMTVEELLKLGVGSVVELERAVGEPVDVFVSDRKLAEGQIVVVNERFGVRITRIMTPAAPGTES